MTASVHVDSPTEGRNPATAEIDRLPTAEVLRLLIAEDATVPAAVAAALPQLTALGAGVALWFSVLLAGGPGRR